LHEDDEFYFVHGYYPNPNDSEHILATTDYGISFASVIGFNNIIATQFHPEKSGRPGAVFAEEFLYVESRLISYLSFQISVNRIK